MFPNFLDYLLVLVHQPDLEVPDLLVDLMSLAVLTYPIHPVVQLHPQVQAVLEDLTDLKQKENTIILVYN